MLKCGMVVEEWLAEDFKLKIDKSTNTTKFTSCASRWGSISSKVQVYISKYLFLIRPQLVWSLPFSMVLLVCAGMSVLGFRSGERSSDHVDLLTTLLI